MTFLLFLWSCTDKSSTKNSIKDTESSISQQAKTTGISDSAITSLKPSTFYVKAKSGLNYRDKPKGEILGKFLMNYKLKVIERTNLFEAITDEEKTVKGEWVGIEKGTDTVYVFDAFLSPKPIKDESLEETMISERPRSNTELAIYELQIYEKKSEKVPYIILTDRYHYIEHPDSMVVADQYLGTHNIANYHTLNSKFRKRFLDRKDIKETDQVFIYHYGLDTVMIHLVRDLPLIATISPYHDSRSEVSVYDYQVGFSLGANSSLVDDIYYSQTFVFIGTENPFVTGNVQPIVWEKAGSQPIPSGNLPAWAFNRLNDYKTGPAYTFSANQQTWYLQGHSNKEASNGANSLMIFSPNNQLVYHNAFFESEGVSCAPVSFTHVKQKYKPEQWTGKIFKNKPPVFWGFQYHSFSCPAIHYIRKENGGIPILCDNRH